MKRALLALFSVHALACLLAAHAQNVTYTNPALAGDYPDPSVIRVGKDYWATATSSEWSPQFPILHSTDLVNWEVVGSVFSRRPTWAVGNFWAPEITKYNDRYYIYYVARKKGGPLSVAVATADKPQGPYTDHGPLVSQAMGSIDPVIFEDEKGDLYLIWKEDGNSQRKPTILWAQRLADDGIKLLGEPKELFRNDASWEGAVIEGPFIVRRGEYFYMFYSGSGCCGMNCNYALGVARSKSLLGPWEKNPANPILAGNNEWKCPGHGSIVDDDKGRYWLLYHAYNANSFVFTGREALLDEVKFTADGWAEINQSHGPTSQAPSPFGRPHRREELKYIDNFTGFSLKPGWNWPVSDENPASISNGKLVLTARADQNTNLMGAAIGRSITTGDFVATATLERSSIDAGEIAGLAALGDRANSTGVALVDDQIIVWNRAANKQQIITQAEAPKSRQIHFRLTAERGRQYQFAYSTNGKDWTELSNTSGTHLPPWDRAVRVGMTVGGVKEAEARFDAFQFLPRQDAAKR
jgi:xylan 1,4-beta-xylosidase